MKFILRFDKTAEKKIFEGLEKYQKLVFEKGHGKIAFSFSILSRNDYIALNGEKESLGPYDENKTVILVHMNILYFGGETALKRIYLPMFKKQFRDYQHGPGMEIEVMEVKR